MRKNSILLNVIIGSVFVLLIGALKSPVAFSAEDQSKLVPMNLDGTEWLVEMTQVSKKGKKITDTDTLKFKDKKFISEKFESNGYEPTNYSLTAEEDGSTRFGTMQVKGKETSFWKGEVKDDVMNGSVHTQYVNGSTSTTYYTGKLTSGILKPKVEEKPKTPTPPPAPPVQEIKATLDVTVLPDVVEDEKSIVEEMVVPVVDQEASMPDSQNKKEE